MNCFQKSYLWLLNTTELKKGDFIGKLWIAFKNLIFDYWTQPFSLTQKTDSSCELLSKILSLTIEHNLMQGWNSSIIVVNCFQKSYLWLLNTTCDRGDVSCHELWIAFKNLIFDYWTQRLQEKHKLLLRCELLSKILSLTIEHNAVQVLPLEIRVVNCFQKSYLWLLNTTYWQFSAHPYCCELLSKILSLTIEHNASFSHCRRYSVVNCFQKSYLWLLNTTHSALLLRNVLLWIAFKNLIFDYWTQLPFFSSVIKWCCELLSKILSLTIEHNEKLQTEEPLYVVNCFQKSYLWLLNTTM